ncbi:MAG: non-ribosomal peptide synthetase, partial [Lysobacteraceae bacterium]
MSTPTREQLLRAALARRLQEQARLQSTTAHGNGNAIPVSDRGQPLPLSFAQQRLWFLARLEGYSEAYHMALALRLQGALDVGALRGALDRIVSRHETLRTTFHQDGDDPVQRIAPPGSGFALQEHDLRRHPHADEALAQRMLEEAHQPFDMALGPPFRGQLVRTADDEHVLLLTMHHVISDAWSLGLLSTELAALYRQHREGGDDPLPPLPIQYADYAQWQRQWLRGPVLEKQTAYWRRTLAGAPTLLELPTDRPRPAQQRFEGDRVPIALDAALTDALKALSKRHGMTLFMTVLAAWATVLSRLSAQAEVVVGTPVANRRRPEVANLIGFFVNTLALRIEVSGSVSALLDRVKAATLDAQDHQELPFEQVVEIVRPPRSLGHTPIFQAMLAWQDMNEGALAFGGVTMSPIDTLYDTAKFDLTLNLGESGDRIVGGLDYATALFDRPTIERHAGYLHRVLAAMAADEQQPVERIALPGDDERRMLLALGDGGPRIACDSVGLYDLVVAQAARTPDAIAVVEPGAELTYLELTQRANGLAERLRALGAGPESRVALLADRTAESIVGVLGILAAGAAYVPLDPAYPDDRLGYVLDDADVLALVAPSALAARAARCASLRPALAGHLLDIGQAPTRDAPPAVALRPDHAAYVIYTSGSTGVPKGVVLEHRGVMNLVQGFIAGHDFAGQRVLMIPPLIFDASVGDVFPALATGAALVLHPDPGALGPETLSRFCRDHRITAIDAPAPLWRQWTEGFIERQADHDAPVLPDLRLMMFGGEGVSLEQVRRFATLTDGRVALSNHYGPTEASVCATMLTTRDGSEIDGSDLPIGRALPGVRIHVLDGQLQLAPIGVEGELCIGGVQVARGYLNRPELTAERFVRDPFVPDAAPDDADARLYRTGDLARWNADGTLQFIGRRDHQVKIRGFRIELSEIEICLAQYPGVREAAVLAREDVPGDKRLVAYVAAADAIDATSLRTHLGGLLPDYMVPAAYVRLDALPLTVNGKLDRKALPAPDASAYVARDYEAPVGEAETAIAAIWAKVLKLDRVGRHDDFFDIGGHSLSAIGLVAALQKQFDAQISDVFRWPTVFEQAQHFRPSRDALRQRIERVKQALATAEAREREANEDPALQVRIDAYRARTEQALAQFGAPRTVPWGCVLLTGATGYLGAYLLHTLVTTRDCRLVVPVRGADQQAAERRLRDVLDHYFGPAFHALCAGRVEVVVADLAAPGLGMAPDLHRRLAAEVDTILHSAANVSHYGPYEDFHRANVVSTEQLLALAVEGKPKRFHFVSTISIHDGVPDAPWAVFTEDDIDI